ncbi:MAG TPA: hypothetical protein VFW73_13535 [Lacipirellulaceae bacterium]|nr:hypothetical protein [Lacipirellulaceae bacterium]
MRRSFVLFLTLLLSRTLAAQAVLPTSPPPDGAWGGYALPAQVPYQPTLPNEPTTVVPGDPNQIWQAYPTSPAFPTLGNQPDAVYLDQPGPPEAHELEPGAPLYPGTNEPDLRASLTPPGARNGFFQRVDLAADWLPQNGYDNIGWTDLHTDVVTALPFFTRENPIIITPSYDLHFLSGPENFDLPPRLNDVAIDFHVFRVYANHWIADVAVTPGLFADDHSFGSSEAWRFNGRAVGVYAPTVDLKYALGVTYVDGGWTKVVPVAGVIYKPTDDVEYSLVFPTPRISWRLPWSPIPGRDERWLYVAIDYGNSAWAFQQTNGTPDVLDYRDYRVILGIERRIVGGLSHRVEIGYVFHRDIKIASVGGDDISMGNTLIARAGISY